MKKALIFVILLIVCAVVYIKIRTPHFPEAVTLPSKFDLRDQNLVPPVKEQAWGTCWAFATTLSMETNLMITKRWQSVEKGIAELSPYYLDKYSGFTRKGDDDHVTENWHSGQGSRYPGSNTDDLNSGLVVHLGGDYKTATAFLSNTRGAPQARLTPKIPKKGDHKLFGDLPTEGVLKENGYIHFFPKSVLWLTKEGTAEEKRVRIKKAIMKYGAVGSAEVIEDKPLTIIKGKYLFGKLDDTKKLDHAINLIGWDDSIEWKGHKGAWIAQDSDHQMPDGKALGNYFILYDDFYVGKDPEMGGVSFQDVMVAPFKKVYTHALHGHRKSTEAGMYSVANRFVASKNHFVQGVGFYTTSNNVSYTLQFKTSLRGKPIATLNGKKEFPGFHFLNVEKSEISWEKGTPLFIELQVDNDSYAYDDTSIIEVLLGAPLPKWGEPVEVKSKAGPNESFWKDPNGEWHDFTKTHKDGNFAINLYTL